MIALCGQESTQSAQRLLRSDVGDPPTPARGVVDLVGRAKSVLPLPSVRAAPKLHEEGCDLLTEAPEEKFAQYRNAVIEGEPE